MKKIILKKPDSSIAISHFQHEFDEIKEKELIIASVASFIFDFHNKELGNQILALISQANNMEIYFKHEIDEIKSKKEAEIEKINQKTKEAISLLLPNGISKENYEKIANSNEFIEIQQNHELAISSVNKKFNEDLSAFKQEKYNSLIAEAEALLPQEIFQVVDSLDLPEERYFRNAWVFDSGEIKVCPNKKLEVIRQKRNRKLAELDKEELAESFKPNGNVEAVKAKKQILRDITKANLSDEEIKNILANNN